MLISLLLPLLQRRFDVPDDGAHGSGDRFRTLAIGTEAHEEFAEQGVNGVFVVERADR